MDLRLDVGDTAPDFQVPSTGGGDFSLADGVTAGRVLLAFYPKSFTSGCTHEMEVLRFLHPRFAGAGVSILGVSVDNLQTQQRFKKTLGLPFELLADDQTAAQALDCLRDSGKAERDVYVIGPGRRIEFAIHKLDPRNEDQYRQLLDAVNADTEG
ncbi:MAG: redoxin domain-containing protein, partial [Chloroflexi bacterium]|nr:redoxin domain-containing protein [Chloroflexota bacterium]